MTLLIYQGHGEGIPGVPAQDLSQSEITRLAGDFVLSENELIDLLCSRGLYSVPTHPKKTKKNESIDTEANEDGV